MLIPRGTSSVVERVARSQAIAWKVNDKFTLEIVCTPTHIIDISKGALQTLRYLIAIINITSCDVPINYWLPPTVLVPKTYAGLSVCPSLQCLGHLEFTG